jgi:hypothetical protein
MQKTIKLNKKESWWFHSIRGMNYFAYKYWFLFLSLFILSSLCFYFLCACKKDQGLINLSSARLDSINRQLDKCCPESNNLNQGTDTTEQEIAIVDSVRQDINPPIEAPRANCRVHFSGGVIAGTSNLTVGISQIYKLDIMSEYVGEGQYPDNTKAFPKAVSTSFDGIAIDRGTHLIIYSQKNYKGEIVLDAYGPIIINNEKWREIGIYDSEIKKTYPEPLESNYPKNKRIWSNSDMWNWSYGSCKIMCSN